MSLVHPWRGHMLLIMKGGTSVSIIIKPPLFLSLSLSKCTEKVLILLKIWVAENVEHWLLMKNFWIEE